MVRIGSKVGTSTNAREGDGEGDSPPTNKEREDDGGRLSPPACVGPEKQNGKILGRLFPDFEVP